MGCFKDEMMEEIVGKLALSIVDSHVTVTYPHLASGLPKSKKVAATRVQSLGLCCCIL